MSDLNPFAPPTNDEPRARVEHATGTAGVPFFLVTRTKFAVMCLMTFGLYQLYWFYRHWRLTKLRTGSDIWPGARAIFAIFFTHALLRDIRLAAAESNVEPRFRVQASAWAFIVLSFLHRLPEPFWMLSLLSFVPLIPVQDTVNEIRRRTAPTADANASFSLGNWVAIAVGLVFWAANVVLPFIPEEPVAP